VGQRGGRGEKSREEGRKTRDRGGEKWSKVQTQRGRRVMNGRGGERG